MQEWKTQLKAAALVGGGALLLALLWKFPGKGAQDAVLWGFFLYAAVRGGARWRVWLTPFGISVLAGLVLLLAVIPFWAEPGESFRLLMKRADMVAALLAVPVVARSRRAVSLLLLCPAVALVAVVWFELIRVLQTFGLNAMAEARWTDPAVLNHHNIGAMAASVTVIVLAAAALAGRRRPLVWIGCLVAAAGLIAYEVVIGSRGPQLALLAGLAALVLLLCSRRAARLGLFGVLGLVLLLLPVINPRFQATTREGLLVERDIAWGHTLTMMKDKPWTGYGYGEKLYRKVYKASKPPRSKHRFMHPHNYVLHIAFMGGWGLAALHVAMWGLAGAGLWRVVRRGGSLDEQVLPAAVLAVIVCIHVYGLIDTPTNVVAMLLMLTIPATAWLLAEKQRQPT